MKHLKTFEYGQYDGDDEGLNQLVRNILDACKMDSDEVEEADPDFIPYIADMIYEWHEKRTKKGSDFENTPIKYDTYHDSSLG